MKVIKEGLINAGLLVLVGMLIMGGIRAAEWLIPAPEERIVVCMAMDLPDHVECRALDKLMRAKKW